MLLFGLALVVMMLFRPAGLRALGGAQARARRRPRDDARARADRATRGAAARDHAASPSASAASRRSPRCRFAIHARRDLRPHRPQRRRQDHALQRAHRPLPARRGRLRVRRRGARPAASRTASPRCGIARTFQNIRLFAQPLGARERDDRPPRAHARGRARRDPARRAARARRKRAIDERARELLDYVGIAHARQRARASTSSYGDQRRLEIARALATEPQAARARRAGRGHERHRERGRCASLLEPIRARRHDDAADRARREAGDGPVRPRARCSTTAGRSPRAPPTCSSDPR